MNLSCFSLALRLLTCTNLHWPVLPAENILWLNKCSFSYLPQQRAMFWQLNCVWNLMLHVEFIIMQDRNIEVCNNTALPRILCFMDVLILRIPLHEISYLLLPGFGICVIIWKLAFGLPDYQTSVLSSSFCRDIVYYFVRWTMRNLVHFLLRS